MSKKYMLFIDDVQLWILRENLSKLLDLAIQTQVREHIVAVTTLLEQLEHPREARERSKGFLELAKKQVLGK